MYIRHIAVSVGAVALAVPLLLLPGTASALPCSVLPGTQSDCLSVTVDGITDSRTLTEGPGESVTQEIAVTVGQTTLFDPFNNNAAFLLEPGTVVGGIGQQSDEVRFNVSQNVGTAQTTLHFTIRSDEDPGRANLVAGIVEDGTLQNVTSTLFPGATCVAGVCQVAGHAITVLIRSDAGPEGVPEPTSLLLLGFGLAGLGLWRRARRGGAQA